MKQFLLAVGPPALFCTVTACSVAGTGLYTIPPTREAQAQVQRALEIEATLDPSTFPERSVGVLPLRVAATDSTLVPLGFGLAELLMGDLARSSQVQVVDRLRVHALMRELALAGGGAVSPDGRPEHGRVLGARHLVVGSLTATEPASVHVDANLARTQDATLLPIVSASTPLDDILEAEAQLALEVLTSLGVAVTPAEREAIVRRPTRSLAALLAFSRGVRAEMEGRLPQALREYRRARQLDRSFAEPRERLTSLEEHFPDTDLLASLLIDHVNRPGVGTISDVTEPAFRGGDRAMLVIPIVIR